MALSTVISTVFSTEFVEKAAGHWRDMVGSGLCYAEWSSVLFLVEGNWVSDAQVDPVAGMIGEGYGTSFVHIE